MGRDADHEKAGTIRRKEGLGLRPPCVPRRHRCRAYNDRFPGHSIFISNDNPQRDRSLEFASLLGAQLKARG